MPDMTNIGRRRFLSSAAALAAGGLSLGRCWADEIPRDVRITRVVGFDVTSLRPKFVGKNSYLDDHGDRATDRMVRISTSAGIEGLGNCRAEEAEVRKLLGKSLGELYDTSTPRMTALGNGTMPLWDLAGKVLGKPVYELLGGEGSERVKVYDGSIYFADLLPANVAAPLDPFRKEIDMGLERGHRAFKIKIGRGRKWMPRKEGDERDREVLQTIRSHAGPDITLGVDANNGYDLAGTKKLLTDLADFRFAFVEEMFPETIKDCLDLKAFIRQNGWETLVADGESWSKLSEFTSFTKNLALDVLQGDMNHFGFEGILQEAQWAAAGGAQIAPHNWGSLIGFYMQLHVGRAVENFYMAENDPLTNDLIVAEGYEIKDGTCSVPEVPGFGLTINEEKFRSDAVVRFDIKA
jgi:L-alanine-DL-glutamate epimerase-like enolase superfamily enzyme